MKIRATQFRLLSFGILLPFLTGCPVEVNKYTATPKMVCLPSTTELSWDAESGAAITIEWSDPSMQSYTTRNVVETRRLPVVQEGETKFVFWARKGGDETRLEHTVFGYAPGRLHTRTLNFFPSCKNNVFQGYPTVYTLTTDDGLLIRTVSNRSAKPIVIQHGGTTATLVAGETTELFAGMDVGGAWQAGANLLSRQRRGARWVSESCDASVPQSGVVSAGPFDDFHDLKRPDPISIDVTFGC